MTLPPEMPLDPDEDTEKSRVIEENVPHAENHPDDVEPDEPVDDSLDPSGGDPTVDVDDAELDDDLNGGAEDPGDEPVLDENPDEDETGTGRVYHDTTGGE
jgi:hypothetical protein